MDPTANTFDYHCAYIATVAELQQLSEQEMTREHAHAARALLVRVRGLVGVLSQVTPG